MSKNIEDFEHLLKKHFHKSKNSKVSIGITHQNANSFFWFGPSAKNQIYYGLGSVSKTLISTYICELVDQNKIDLNHSLSEYLELDSKRSYPKIIDLLTHTSGYHGFIPFLSTMSIMLMSGFNKKNIYKHTTKKWLYQSIEKIKPLKRTKYRYSDYNYAVLALIIETIEQKPFKEVILEYMTNQIGMHNTYYGSYLKTLKDPYSWIWDDENPFLASGGLFSTIDDMILFLSYQIKYKEKLEVSHTKYAKTNLNKNVYTGFSWNSFVNGCFYWHIGGQGYYRSYALFDTKKQICIVILSTVDVQVQHVNRLGSSLYRNVKRNPNLVFDFLTNEQIKHLNV